MARSTPSARRGTRDSQFARSSALLLKLADSLFARPASSMGETKLLGVTPASASANITRLVDAGILREVAGRTRDRIYLAQPILDLMNDRGAPVTSREPTTCGSNNAVPVSTRVAVR